MYLSQKMSAAMWMTICFFWFGLAQSQAQMKIITIPDNPSGLILIAPNGDTTVQTPSNGHMFIFFVPSSGPIGISEGAPIGSPQILNADLVAAKTPAELYQFVARPGATVPDALVNAQNRSNAQVTTATPGRVVAPVPAKGAAGSGAHFFDSGEQSWFKSTYCQSGWECVQGWEWANSSYGYVQGRGYQTYALNGSEASCSRRFNEDYWNGSRWANLVSVSVQPGWVYSEWAGNTGDPTPTDGSWYFRSELADCGGTYTQVSLADFTYTAPYTCAVCNDGSCQCGYQTGPQLCASHGGQNPSLGCVQESFGIRVEKLFGF